MPCDFNSAYIPQLRKLLEKYNISSDVISKEIESIHIENDAFSDVISVSSNGHYVFNVKKLTLEEGSFLKELIVKKIDEDKSYIALKSAEQVRTEFIKDSKSNEYELKLHALESYVTPQDYKIFRIANRIRSNFRQNKNIRMDKDQLIRKYGARGKNISNLFTAGYFDELVFPLFEKLKGDKEKFLKEYNNIIDYQAFALFVNKNMDAANLAETMVEKLLSFKEAGLKNDLTVHGIGRENCAVIEEAITSLKTDIKITTRVQELNICKIVVEWNKE